MRLKALKHLLVVSIGNDDTDGKALSYHYKFLWNKKIEVLSLEKLYAVEVTASLVRTKIAAFSNANVNIKKTFNNSMQTTYCIHLFQ